MTKISIIFDNIIKHETVHSLWGKKKKSPLRQSLEFFVLWSTSPTTRTLFYHTSTGGKDPILSIMWVCMLSHSSCFQFFVTLWTVAVEAHLSMGFSRNEYYSGLPCCPPGDLPDPGIKPMSLTSPALAGRFFTTVPPRKKYSCPKYMHGCGNYSP